MNENTIVMVKRLSVAKDMESPELRYHRFYAMSRTGTPGEDPFTEIRNRTQFESALKHGCDVIAVNDAPMQIPLVVTNVRAIDAGRRFNVYAWLSLAIAPNRRFYEWVRGALQGKATLTDVDVWEELYGPYGLGDFFKELFNESNVELLEKHGKGAIDFSGMAGHLPDWLLRPGLLPWTPSTTGEVVLSCFPEAVSDTPSAEFRRAFQAVEKIKRARMGTISTQLGKGTDEIVRAWGGKLRDALKVHPFRVLFGVIAFFALVSLFRGCREKVEGVKGSLTVRVEKRGPDGGRELLRKDAEQFALQLIDSVSEHGKAWRNGATVRLPGPVWAKVVTSTQKFATERGGEFTCDVSGNDVTLTAHPQALKTVTLDIAPLCGNTELIAQVRKAFGVSFGGKTEIRGIPFRAVRLEAAFRELAGGKLKWKAEDGKLVFSPDLNKIAATDPTVAGIPLEKLRKMADEFWTVRAPEMFVSIPRDVQSLKRRFGAFDHPAAGESAPAERQLGILLKDIEQAKENALFFLEECGKPWKQFSTEIPPDKNARIRDIQDALKDADELRQTVEERCNRASFDRDLALFEQKKTAIPALRQSFKPLDHSMTNGFDAAERALDGLLSDMDKAHGDLSRFLTECGTRWQIYNFPEKEAKLREIREAVKHLENLRKAAGIRRIHVAFDRDLALHAKTKAELLRWSREMFLCYDAQQSRLSGLRALLQRMAEAKAAGDFSKIEAFEKEIDEAERTRQAKREREMRVGAYIASWCGEGVYSRLLGDQWGKKTIARYNGKVEHVVESVRGKTSSCAEEVVRLYREATLEKALAKADALAKAVQENHAALTESEKKPLFLSEDPRETALLFGLRNGLQTLRRAQLRSSRQPR